MRRSFAMLLGALLLLPLAPPAHGQADPPVVSLEEALVLFHRNSPSLASVRSRLRRESAEARQSRALPNPTASFTNEDLGGYAERYLNLRQDVGALWSIGALGRRAQAVRNRAQTRFQADSAVLVLEVERAYVDAWHAEQRVVTLRSVFGIVDSLLTAAITRYQEGDLAGYDVRRLRVERSTAARNLAREEVELSMFQERLGSLVGELGGRLGALGLEDASPDLAALDAHALALRQRPEVAEARSQVGVWEAESSLARLSIVRGASFVGGFKTQSDGQEGVYLGLELPLPLLDRRGGAAEAARAGVREAESEVDWVLRAVGREASLAWARLASVRSLREELGDAGVAEGEALLDIARVAYDEGEIGIVELVDAADAHLQAQLLEMDLRVEEWLAYFELEHAIGGLGSLGDAEGGDER